MDLERWKITAETTAIRGRGWVRAAVRLVGLVVVIAGGLHRILVDAVLPVAVYRETWVALAGIPAWPLGDFVAIGVGAAVAWVV